MKTWKDISLYKFQQIERINASKDMPEDDRAFMATCIAFDIPDVELNNMKPLKALKKVKRVAAIFETPFVEIRPKRIGRYQINYDPSLLTFGQFIELSFFLQDPIHRAHLALASIARIWWSKYKTDGHRQRSDFFLSRPVEQTIGALTHFMQCFQSFNEEFKSLFGLDKEMYEPDVQPDRFNRRYGWTYSASLVATYEGISLDQAYGLPIRQALNDLAYLKEKARYDAEQLKNSQKK